MRVLHAPANVGNQPWVLSRYERQLGLASDLWINVTTSFAYSADRVLVRPDDPWDAQLRARLVAGLQAPLDYDAFHFYFGRTILGGWDEDDNGVGYRLLDLDLAHRLGKPIVFTLQGCDARLAGESAEVEPGEPIQHVIAQARLRVFARRLKIVDEVAKRLRYSEIDAGYSKHQHEEQRPESHGTM